MQAKPVALLFALALVLTPLSSGSAQEPAGEAAKPPPAIPVVLYADPPATDDAVPEQIIAARNALRDNHRLEVLLFNTDSPTFVLAARHDSLSLSPDAVASLDQRKAMTEAVGGNFFAVLSKHGKRSKNVDAVLYETAPVAQSWSFLDRDPENLAQSMAGQIESAGTTPAPSAIPIASPAVPVALPDVPVTPPAAAPPAAVPTPIKPKPSTTEQSPTKGHDESSQFVPLTSSVIPKLPVIAPAPPAQPMLVPVPAAPPAPKPAPAPMPIAVPAPVNTVQPEAPKTAPVLAQPEPPHVAPTIAVTKLTPPVTSPSPDAVALMPVPAASVPVSAVPVPPPVVLAPTPPPITETAPAIAPPVASETPAPAPPDEKLSSAPPPGSVVSDDARRLIASGDVQQRSSDFNAAIDSYRQAINLAPRASEPRLKLAQAFLQAGMRDQAISEARRALAIDPSSQDARDFLTTLGASDAGETQIPTNQANVTANPKDQTAWLALGDSCWNANKLPDALAAYKSAVDLDPAAVAPQARLARLYAAQGDYAKSLTALDKAGNGGYPYALEIIASETENLFGEIDAAEELFERGENTREQCYKRLKAADKAAQDLADFVANVKPPEAYRLSHLHRQLSTRLLAQDTAGWITYSETGEVRYKSVALTLEKEAVREMETASAAERARDAAQ